MEQKGISDTIRNKNKIRKMLKFFFQERNCMTFVRPVKLENDLRNLNNLNIEDLREKFVF